LRTSGCACPRQATTLGRRAGAVSAPASDGSAVSADDATRKLSEATSRHRVLTSRMTRSEPGSRNRELARYAACLFVTSRRGREMRKKR
jgi:hypothetical protein